MAKLVKIVKDPKLWIGLAVALGGYGSLDPFTEEPLPPPQITVHPPQVTVHCDHGDLLKRVEYLEGLDEHVH